MSYSELMKSHLGSYKKTYLGITESGKWRGREYDHILPPSDIALNILQPIQRNFADYQASHPNLKLHTYFAHLNSSQAACINLFLPLLGTKLATMPSNHSLLGFDAKTIETYEFEYVPNGAEGTNFDFWARMESSEEIFCEFKLTEVEFARAKNDERHRQKLKDIYLPMLTGKVSPELLEPTRFFAHYQLLRNIAYAESDGSASVLFLVPRGNERLIRPLAEMREWLSPTIQPFVKVLYLEDVVSKLRSSLDRNVSTYYDAYADKYLPPNCSIYEDCI